MPTNPREQNLNSPVVKAIKSSIQSENRDFHLKNRGIFLSAKNAVFSPSCNGRPAVKFPSHLNSKPSMAMLMAGIH
ncbi:AIPR family protein [uncultured Oscillibacter sp.]|uniref:AIPR family protein n=1 Tax=uncultured Oscillibacter sp. TaxID=876091 RepID=UPI00345BE1F7